MTDDIESRLDEQEATIEQQQQRIDQLESLIRNLMPDASRRDALKLLAGAGAGAVGAQTLFGSAAAGSNEVGQVGTSSERVDLFAEDIDVSDTADVNALQLSSSPALTSIAASGSTTLSSGSATVDTGISESTTATFMLALGPDTDDAEVAGDIQAASSGNYEVFIEETDTSVGNPTVRYDVIRVR